MTYTGLLYAIRSRNTDRMYIGFTFDSLVEELSVHVYRFVNGLKCESSEILKHGDYYIELLKKVTCERKKDMILYQQNSIAKSPTVNKKSRYKLCECGSMVVNMTSHLGTKIHRDNLKGIKPLNYKELIKCECGVVVTRRGKYAHIKTLKHLKAMEALNTCH